MRAARMVARGALVVLAATLPDMARAADATASLCRLLLHENSIEITGLELSAQQARTEQAAAAEIFALVEGLWKNQVVERMIYLAARHDRDLTQLEVQRQAIALRRQRSAEDQYLALCGPGDERPTVDEAFQSYLQADCELSGVEVEIGRVDLAFRKELRKSVLDLRKNDVATRQDVVRAERDVQLAEQELRSARERADACRREPG